MNKQLALSIKIKDEATFADFNFAGNELLQNQLAATLQTSSDKFLYLWGINGCGKSHLLQACCHATSPLQSAIYLPLCNLKEWGPQSIEGLELQSIVCIDDIETIAGDAAWEEALFHLYNRIKDQEEGILIVTSTKPPAQSGLKLLDLRSRLSAGLTLQIHELTDDEKIHTLQQHATKRGFYLPDSVGQYLITRCARNMHDLQEILNTLDEVSLQAHRKITIPFVKDVLQLQDKTKM
jgi:DnaA family protein